MIPTATIFPSRGLSGGIQSFAGSFAFGLVALSSLLLGQDAPPALPDHGVGRWIWAETLSDRQEVRFVKRFRVPEGGRVESAVLRITADNSYELYLDGQEIGSGADWRCLIEYDVSLLLSPGEHSLAVKAHNDFDSGGLIVGLRIRLADGSLIKVDSDNSWRIAPNNDSLWLRASPDIKSWTNAAETRQLWGDASNRIQPQVYKAPVSLPLRTAFWQKGWFQASLALVTLCSLLTGLYLAIRLFIKSSNESVVRRERTRIAADLHDDIGGGLTQLVLLGETSRRDTTPGSAAEEAMMRLSSEARNLLRAMNESVWLINSQRDTVRDFASYMAKHAEAFFIGSPVRCRFEIQSELPSLPCDLGVRRNLFLAVKEALHNVLRHSNATLVELKIRVERQDLVVTIRDNGRGFDSSVTDEGNGLRNMRARVAEAGGRFGLGSEVDHGCELEFRVPVQAMARLRSFPIYPWKRKEQGSNFRDQKP